MKNENKNNEKLLFGSDYHFSHTNIMKFCPTSRPYKGIEEMNEDIVKIHNSFVGKNDTFYFLGDFSFAKHKDEIEPWFDRLNGRKHLIIGNHDHQETISLGWESVNSHKEFRHNKVRVVLNHYPLVEHNGYHYNTPEPEFHLEAMHLYGHVHSTKGKPYTKSPNEWAHDVGFDRNQRPLSFDELVQHFKTPYL